MHQFLKLLEANLVVPVLVGLLYEVPDVVDGHFLPHLLQHFLEALDGDALLVAAVEYLEGLQHVLLASDGEHHPGL